MKFCQHCGKQNPDENRICIQCGTNLEDIPSAPIPQKTNLHTKSSLSSGLLTLFKKIITLFSNKKILIPSLIIVSLASILIVLISTHVICINHNWQAPTCIEPAQCSKCDRYKDDILGNHKWMEATCTEPTTCFWCDAQDGSPEHNWQEATCTEPKTCTECEKTEGAALGHVNGEWTVTEAATFSGSGTEELSCTRCSEVIESRTIARKTPKVEGKSFNFDDDEFIEWFNDHSTNVTIGYSDIGLFDSNSGNTSYRISYPNENETGALILNHGDNGKNGKVSAIMIYFENTTIAGALGMLIGEKIDSNFDSKDAAIKAGYNKSYTAANMTGMLLNLDDDFKVYALAPSEFLAEIVS